MVTINAQQLTQGWAVAVSCLAADDKPTAFTPPGVYPPGPVPIPNGAELRELDTGKLYRFDADSAAWFPQPAAQDEAADLGLTGASVGDLVRVNAVDSNGKPTSWRKAPLCEIKTNPNLLDNWYFGNPVNQRELGIYVSDGYCFDRWIKTVESHISKQSQDGYVEIKIASGYSSANFSQKIENPYQLSNKTITLSAMANGPCFIIIVANGSEVSRAASPNTGGVDVFSISTLLPIVNSLEIYVQAVGTTNLYAVKLELGSEQTLAHNEGTEENPVWVLNEVPDYGEELARCQRYFINIGSSAMPLFGRAISTTDVVVGIALPVPMRSTPNVSCRSFGTAGALNAVSGVIASSVTIENIRANYAVIHVIASNFTPGTFYGWFDYLGLTLSADL